MKTTASKGIKTGRSLNNYEQDVLLPILTQGLELKKVKKMQLPVMKCLMRYLSAK